jgi:hypothetical protein
VALDPFADLTEDELWDNQLLIQMICNRSKSPLAQKRRSILCNLGFRLSEYAGDKGFDIPAAPFSTSQLRTTK